MNVKGINKHQKSLDRAYLCIFARLIYAIDKASITILLLIFVFVFQILMNKIKQT